MILDFLLKGFLQQQASRDMQLQEKLAQILQNQQTTDEAIAQINETITTETSQVTEALVKLADVNAIQAQLIEQQNQQIKNLLAQVDEGDIDLATANEVIDQILQKQQEQLTSQQEAVNRIAAIFNPPITEEQPATEQV